MDSNSIRDCFETILLNQIVKLVNSYTYQEKNFNANIYHLSGYGRDPVICHVPAPMGQSSRLDPFKTEQERAVLFVPGCKSWGRCPYTIIPLISLPLGSDSWKNQPLLSAENLQPLTFLKTEITSCSILPWDIGEGAKSETPGRYTIKIADTDFHTFL